MTGFERKCSEAEGPCCVRATRQAHRDPWVWLSVVLVLAATVTPLAGSPPQLALCLICGERGLADALSNILLFMPLGLALGRRGTARTAVLVGLALSGLIEGAQLTLVAGRHPSIGDLTFNTLGAGLGSAIARWLPGLVRPAPGRARAYRVVAAALMSGVLLGGAALRQPAPTPDDWYAQWTAELGEMERFDGTLLSASIHGREMSDGLLADRGGAEAFMREGALLRLEFVPGEAPLRLAPIFSIYDVDQREILLVGADRTGLVVRFRTHASALRLDGQEVRIDHPAMRFVSGVNTELWIQRLPRAVCVRAGDQRICEAAPSALGAWEVLGGGRLASGRSGTVLNALLAMLLTVPLGFWSGSARARGGMAILACGMIMLLPWLGGAAPARLTDIAGGLAGFSLGWGLLRQTQSTGGSSLRSDSTQRSILA